MFEYSTGSIDHIVSNLKADVSAGQDMIAFATGRYYKQYAKIVMSSTSPATIVSTQGKIDSTT